MPSTARDELLQRINRDLPQARDWKAGALSYLNEVMAKDRERTMRFVLTKPLHHAADQVGMDEARWYLHNFANVVDIVGRRPGCRVLDVACGGGWLSHFLTRLGFCTVGFDISADFVDAARRRLAEDPNLKLSREQLDQMFTVHDIELAPLPADAGTFDVIVLESCLHHLFDPIAGLTNLAAALADDGIVICIEGENRTGPINPEFVAVMDEYSTIERPYARADLVEAMALAGLHAVEFFGSLDGWRSPLDPASHNLSEELIVRSNALNFAVCARSSDELRAMFPFHGRAVAIDYGRGFHADEGTHRWAECQAEFTVAADSDVSFEIVFAAGHELGERQVVIAYGARGEISRCEISPGASAVLDLGRLGAGDRVRLCSAHGFDPLWPDGNGRFLSFAVRATCQPIT